MRSTPTSESSSARPSVRSFAVAAVSRRLIVLLRLVPPGMAKLLLGHVVDGPEIDLIWSGLHPDEAALLDDDNDEENEARLLHPGGEEVIEID